MKLAYRAIGQDGKVLTGTIDAKDRNEAATYLRTKNLLPVRISEKKNISISQYIPLLNRTHKDVVLFTRQLSSMISSGLTLLPALRLLQEQVEGERMKEIISDVISDIEDGSSLTKSLERHVDVFGPIYISLVKAAEASGLLDKILLRLADNLEKGQRLKGEIKGALLYPAIVFVGMVIVFIVMMVAVVPQFTGLYKQLNVQLPFATQVVVAISNIVTVFWPLVIGVLAAGIFAFIRWRKTDAGRLITDDFSLKIPIVGKLIRESLITEITRTLGLLVGAGTLVVDGIKETANVSGNVIYRNAMLNISRNVEKGIPLSDAMTYTNLFPPIVIEMTRNGEETGKIDESLLRLSEYYEREVDGSVKTFTTLLEPIIIAVLGVGVAFLLIAVVMPIYSILNSFQ